MKKQRVFPKRGVLHYVSDDKLIYSLNEMLFYDSDAKQFVLPLEVRPNFDILNRIFRRGIHKVIENGCFIFVIVNAQIQIICTNSQRVVSTHSLRGNRPLVIEKYRDGIVYGEYSGNKHRKDMTIVYVDRFGVSRTLASIPRIRHIHSITEMEYSRKYIVTTGDEDHESKIMLFDENFHDYRIIAEGTQNCRVVQPIVRSNYLYFGTDMPDSENHIYKIELSTGVSRQLAKIPGPVFFGIKKDSNIFFSTVVEPSQVNDQRFCYLLQIGLDDNVSQRGVFRKDMFPMKLCQYGQIIFPRYDHSTNNLIYFTEFATSNHLSIGSILF